MKVLLADPPQVFLQGRGATRQIQPLGLAYLGAVLEADHDVRFLLPDVRPWRGDDPWGELARAIEAEAPDVVGISAVTATWPAARTLAEVIKGINPETLVVAGGPHASADPLAALRSAPAVDLVVRGEGEETMRALMAALGPSRRPADPGSIEGLAWRDGDQLRLNAPRPSIRDLDTLPFPKRDGLVWGDGELHPSFYQAMITLRGCPYRCIYCAVPSSNDRQTRYRSAGNVLDEIEHLIQTHAIPYLFFHDSVFTLHRGRTVEICQGMIDRGLTLPFACQTRADRVDPELLDLLKEAGCHQIFFGVESGDATSLVKIRKKMPLETIRTAVAEVKARDIRCTGFFMVGFPWEDEALIEATADFAVELGLDAISLFSATPLPGTELWEMAGGGTMPDAIDFRTPQVNITGMDEAAYREVFSRVKARIDAHNRTRMHARFEELTGRRAPARRDWQDTQGR